MKEKLKKVIMYSVEEYKVKEWTILLVYCILLYNDWIVYERIKVLFFALFVIWTYITMMKIIEQNLTKFIFFFYSKISDKEKFMLIYEKILVIIARIHLYKSILWYLHQFEFWLFFWFRRLNLRFLNHEWIRNIIYLFMFGFILHPIKYIFRFYYSFIEKIKEKALVELFTRRIYGLLVSVLFLTPIWQLILYNIKWQILIVLVYFCFVFISIAKNMAGEEKVEEKPFDAIQFSPIIYITLPTLYKKDERKDLYYLFCEWASSWTNVHGLLMLKRNANTIIGKVIIEMLFFMKQNDRVLHIQNQELFSMYFEVELYDLREWMKNKFDKFYVQKAELVWQILSDFERMHIMKQQIKYKIYTTCCSYISDIINLDFCDLLYGMEKYKDNEEKIKKIKQLYTIEEQLLKYKIFKVWDMEKYVGMKENNCYIAYTSYSTFSDRFFIKVQEEEYIKNNAKFLDIEDNFEEYVKIIAKCESYYDIKIDGIDVCEFMDGEQLSDIWQKLVKYTCNEKRELIGPDVTNLLPYLKKMEENLLKLREEWEREWEQGKRNYIWKANET
jgi:hypothetical protein